jgi:DNA-binding response OmpR family regulator
MKRVLIIDNDEATLDVLQEAFCYEGFDVRAVNETNNIFLLIDEHAPDILLVDYILNGINGGELCSQVKADSRTSKLPVIIMSSYHKVFLSLGNYRCDDFIPKPFDLFELIDRVKKQVTH